jgi:hypothetical protein
MVVMMTNENFDKYLGNLVFCSETTPTPTPTTVTT